MGSLKVEENMAAIHPDNEKIEIGQILLSDRVTFSYQIFTHNIQHAVHFQN